MGDGNKGQILIIIILVVIVLFAGFYILSAVRSRRNSPTVVSSKWVRNGQVVTDCLRGQQLRANITLNMAEEYVGSVVVKIRKDISLWPDDDYAISTFPINSAAGEKTSLVLTFEPDQISSGRLKGYFIEVQFLVTGGKWTMENTYPPRLKVFADSSQVITQAV